jgi:CYTH domain-containing protein
MLIGQTTNTDEFSPLRLLFSHWHQTQDEMARYSKDTATHLFEYCVHHSLLKGLVVEEVEQQQQQQQPVQVFGRA